MTRSLKPDDTTHSGRAIRFGCGVILTFAIGIGMLHMWEREGLIILAGIALVVGVLAAAVGDTVLEWILHRVHWF